jgi:hypothetical protein
MALEIIREDMRQAQATPPNPVHAIDDALRGIEALREERGKTQRAMVEITARVAEATADGAIDPIPESNATGAAASERTPLNSAGGNPIKDPEAIGTELDALANGGEAYTSVPQHEAASPPQEPAISADFGPEFDAVLLQSFSFSNLSRNVSDDDAGLHTIKHTLASRRSQADHGQSDLVAIENALGLGESQQPDRAPTEFERKHSVKATGSQDLAKRSFK